MPQAGDPHRGASGEYTVRGVPRGVTSLTPYVAVLDVEKAVDFYREVFGARVVEVTTSGGTVVHAHLDLGNGHLHVEAPNPGFGLAAPSPGGASFSLGFYCEDINTVLVRARARGAEVLMPPVDFASGDRFVAIRDPSGVRWSIVARVEDLSETESADRIAAWVAARDRDRC